MKYIFTIEELINNRLSEFSSDPDFEFNALAGYIETKEGFVWHNYYSIYLEKIKKPTFRLMIRTNELNSYYKDEGCFDSFYKAVKHASRFYRACGKLSKRPGLFSNQIVLERSLLAYNSFALITEVT